MTEEIALMHQGIDSRAMFATYITKLPGLLILAVTGAILGSGLNLFVVLVKTQEACYVSETEYYIDFADGRYEARDYYNDFTWNDVIKTDEILGRAMELLGSAYDRDQVSTMISARILSDVRYLTVYVRGQDLAQVEAVKNALGTALEEFATRKDELFDAIDRIEDLEIVLEEIPWFGWRAALLGAVIAAGIGVFVVAFRFCMGSAFYTKGDITVRLGIPVCGMMFQKGRRQVRGGSLYHRQTEMLAGNLKMLAEKYPRILLMDASGGQEAASFLQDIQERGMVDCSGFQVYDTKEGASETSVIMAVIPFGKPYRERIADEINDAQMHGAKIVSAVLTQSDRTWMEIYYAWRNARVYEQTGRM